MAGEFWPALHPPLLNRLPTTATQPREVIPSTLEIEIEQMDRDEDRFANQMDQIRQFGYAHLIPLGRLNTQEEDQESSFTSSPAAQRLLSPEIRDNQPNHDFPQPQPPGIQAPEDQETDAEQEEDLDAAIESADDSFGGDLEEDEQSEEDQLEEGEEERLDESAAASPIEHGGSDVSEGSHSAEDIDIRDS